MFGVRRALLGIRKSRALQATFPVAFKCSRNSFGFVAARAFNDKGVEDELIQDFNTELELLFGSRSQGPAQLGEGQNLKGNLTAEVLEQAALASSKHVFPEAENVFRIDSLSHVDDAGKAAMVNVADKTDSKRLAVASGKVFLSSQAFDLVATNSIAKGDVLTVAKIAGIHGAKQTSSLIPLCHNVLLSGIDITLTLNEDLHAVEIRAEATASGPTGVEMEALTAVSVAGLTVYDMCKSVSKNISISSVQLECKTGGKSGDWFRY